MSSGEHCPLCNGAMDYQVLFERLTVCVDCHDDLSGRGRGSSRTRWERLDQTERMRHMRVLAAQQYVERHWNRAAR